jgi:hypothetical protein
MMRLVALKSVFERVEYNFYLSASDGLKPSSPGSKVHVFPVTHEHKAKMALNFSIARGFNMDIALRTKIFFI